MECLDKQLAAEIDKIISHKKANAHLEKKLPPSLLRTLVDNTFRLLTPYY